MVILIGKNTERQKVSNKTVLSVKDLIKFWALWKGGGGLSRENKIEELSAKMA